MISAAGFIGDAVSNIPVVGGALGTALNPIGAIGDLAGGAGDFLLGSGGNDAAAFRAPGFQQQGQLLHDILTGQASGIPQTFQGFTPGQAIPGQQQGLGQNIFNQADFRPQFTQRNPFQFQTNFDPLQAVGDAFTPQAQRVQDILGRRGEVERQQIQEDLNRRGLLTAGATTEALGQQREREAFDVSNALAQLAGQQAQQQLGASQFGAQLDFNRQLQQAAEIFRQQGATDTQALQLANTALAGQQQAFGQGLQGRQLSLGELAFQNQLQQQPIENLQRLFALSAGQTPGNAGSPGFLGPILGSAGGSFGEAAGGGLANMALSFLG